MLADQYPTYSAYLEATPLPEARTVRYSRLLPYRVAVIWDDVDQTYVDTLWEASPAEALAMARARWIDDPDLWAPADRIELTD